MELKHFMSCALTAAVLGFVGAGCSLFSNEVPPEDLTPVPEAIDDPGYNATGLGAGAGGILCPGAGVPIFSQQSLQRQLQQRDQLQLLQPVCQLFFQVCEQ